MVAFQTITKSDAARKYATFVIALPEQTEPSFVVLNKCVYILTFIFS